jgi:hypothetical protein
MSLKTLLMVVPVLSLVALTGCKASCTGLCDDAKDQDCASTDKTTITFEGVDYEEPKSTFDHAGCYASCQREEDMEDDDVNECADEFSTLTDCMNSQSDICKTFESDELEYLDHDLGLTIIKPKKCGSEYVEYAKCYYDYCKDHQKRDYCN